MQARIANCEAIQNYDVGIKHWIGFFLPETTNGTNSSSEQRPSENLSSNTAEYLSVGRLVVDRKDNWVFYVREISTDLKGQQKKRFEYMSWRDGIETAFSNEKPIASTRACTFERFCKIRDVPIIENTIGEISPLSDDSIEADYRKTLKAYESSIVTRHRDGSATTVLMKPGLPFRVHLTFDPISTMPTRIKICEYEPDSDKLVRVLKSGNPRYEKNKEIYRIVSLEYNRPEWIDSGNPVESVGTCQFFWHQFNEDAIRFPSDSKMPFSLEEATKFLEASKLELVK
ncbi:MAG: hypothetical protein ABL921_03325 [Pirellula sp.]